MTSIEIESVNGESISDEKNFLERAYIRYFSALKRRLRSQRFDDATAEDLAQSVFVKLAEHKAPETIRDTEGYIYGIARNVAADHCRANIRKCEIEEQSQAEFLANGHSGVSPEDSAIHADALQNLLGIVDNLPTRRREILLLHRFRGYDHAEIATMLNISEETVRHHIYLALRDCKAAMKNIAPSSVNGTSKSRPMGSRVNGFNGHED